MEYFFILGRNPALSVAEIEAVLEPNIKQRYFGYGFYIIETKTKLDLADLQERLGGSVKTGNIFAKPLEQKCCEEALLYLKENAPKEKKLNFAVNFYGCNFSKKDSLEMKKKLSSLGIKSRLVYGREPRLSSVATQKNILDKNGAEINCFMVKNKIWLGRTITCQPFEALSRRDFGRPMRDQISGMLPPKLAKIMINLAQPDKKNLILDPFAGSGTILMEAALVNYTNLIGADIDEQAIENTRQNLYWLAERGFISRNKLENIKLIISDIRQIDKKITPASVDTIVTEPYLGPPLKRRTKPQQIQQIKKEIERLYAQTFEKFSEIIKAKGRVVIIFPVFTAKEMIFIDILEQVAKLGFKIKNPAKDCGQDFEKFMPRGGIIASRPDQRVAREIFIFEKD